MGIDGHKVSIAHYGGKRLSKSKSKYPRSVKPNLSQDFSIFEENGSHVMVGTKTMMQKVGAQIHLPEAIPTTD